MNKQKYTHFIGIDVSKDTLDFSVICEEKELFHQQVANSLVGISAFRKEAKQHHVDLKQSLFCLEHTGIYSCLPSRILHDKRYAIWIETPIAIKRSGGLQRGKNDKVDAYRIAPYNYRFQDKKDL